MYRYTDWPYWLHKNPKVLKDRITAAYIEGKGNLPKIFKLLGLTAFSFYKYVKELGMKEEIVQLRTAMFPNQAFRGRWGLSAEESKPSGSIEKPRPKAQPAVKVAPKAAPKAVSKTSFSSEDSGVWSIS